MENFKDKKWFLILIEVAKWGLILLVVISVILQFTGNKVSKAPFKKVSKATVKYADTEMMQEGSNQMIKRLYGLDPEAYSDIALWYPKTNMGSEEVLVVKLKNIDQQDEVKKAVEGRLATQKKNFDGYGTYQYGMLEKSITDVKGNYILFASAKKPEKVKESFEKAL